MLAELTCLALAVYYEARSEPLPAQLAVAQVVLQRVESRRFPDSICAVVKQGPVASNGMPIRHRCAFSYYCDGRGETPRDTRAWRMAWAVTIVALLGARIPELDGALHYHATWIEAPSWAKELDYAATFGQHRFYR